MSMVRQGARVSLILALVFPAIICAAVALAYYGYSYAVAASVRSKRSLMEGNQQPPSRWRAGCRNASTAWTASCSRRSSGTTRRRIRPSSFELPAGVESVVVLDEGLRIRSVVPGARSGAAAARARALAELRQGPELEVAEAVDAEPAGNFRHLHQLFEGKSVLIAYVAKKTETGRNYYVAAKLDLGLVAKDWIPDEIDDVPIGHRRGRDPRRGGAPDLRRAAARRPSSSTSRRSARRCTRGASRSRPATWPSCASRPTRSGCWACCSCRCRW